MLRVLPLPELSESRAAPCVWKSLSRGIAMQGCPRPASDDGLLWEFLSQVGLWGQTGRSDSCLESLRHG